MTDVNQLEGGIHRYLEKYEEDGGHWVGKNYTFDKRSYLQIINSGDKISKKEEDHYKVIRDENNKQFKKTCFINSEYNRCVMFDAMEYHAAENFFSRSKEDRYTYITFWHELWHKDKQLNPNLSSSQRVVP